MPLSANAEQPEWPGWIPLEALKQADRKLKKVAPDQRIPADKVELIIKTYDGEPPTQEIPEPSRTLVLGVRNLDNELIDGQDLVDKLIIFGIVCCRKPDGSVLKVHVPSIDEDWAAISRRRKRLSPEGTKLGETFFYPIGQKPVRLWFGPMKKEGTYRVWWEYAGKQSNTLIFVRQTNTLTYLP